MKKIALIGMLAVMAFAVSVNAQNLLVNGDFGTGDETGWTRWRAPWGSTEVWSVTSNGPTPPEGTLSGGGGQGSFGWYQVVEVPASEMVAVEADWAGDIGSAGWAEIMLYTSDSATADWAGLADAGAAANIAYKKDSWGQNPPTTWDWEKASLSPANNGNGGVIHSLGWVCVAVKLGASGAPLGVLSVDNITLTPEPAAALLLGLPLLLIRRRRA